MAITGKLPSKFPYKVRDKNGILLADEMKKNVMNPDVINKAKYTEKIKTFFELHIEQGSVLEKSDLSIGIVSEIAGVHQLKLTIYGKVGHAGAISMSDRNDPMVASGLIIAKIEKLVSQSKDYTRGTVGYIKTSPGGHNIIPEKVELTIDFCYIDRKEHESLVEELKEYIKILCNNRKLFYDLIITQNVLLVHLDLQIINLLVDTAKFLKIHFKLLPSWAGHDAMIMNSICPIVMIFIRSQKGLSHCPEEYSLPEDIALGADLLTCTLEKVANNIFE